MAGTTWMLFNNQKIDNILGIRGRGIEIELKQKNTDLPLQSGSQIRNIKFENKKIRVNLLLEKVLPDQCIEDLKAALVQSLYTLTMSPIVFGDDLNHEWSGILSGTELIKESPTFAEVELSFMCHPIRTERSEITYENIDGNTYMNAGRDTDGIMNFTISDNRSQQVINRYGSIAKITLASSSLNGSWRIDTEKREVYLNNVLAMTKIDFKNTNWLAPENQRFCVPSGAFRFDFTPAVMGASLIYKRRCL